MRVQHDNNYNFILLNWEIINTYMLFLYQQMKINVWITFMLQELCSMMTTAPVEELVLADRLSLASAFLMMELNLREYQ